jgi:hypothetical protein
MSLVNSDAVSGDNKVKTEEGGNLPKRVNGPMFFIDFNDELISRLVAAHTKEIVSGTTENNGSFMKDTAVYRGISTIGKKREIIEDNRFNVFLPAEACIDSTLNKAVHGDGEFIKRMILEKLRDLWPPLGFALANVVKPGMVNLEPSAITIDVARIRSTLKGIVNIKVVVFKL